MRYIDLSGFAFTGKSAVTDLLREFSGYRVPDSEFELCLFRLKDGLFDLEHALVNDWSPLRSDAAVRRFMGLVKVLGNQRSKLSLEWMMSPSGYNYDDLVNERFTELSLKYIAGLVDVTWDAEWPFAFHDVHALEVFARRVALKLGNSKKSHFKRYLASGDGFYEKTRLYLESLFWPEETLVESPFITNNAFEPFRANSVSNFFKDGKVIVVDRDPRDVYCSGLGKDYSPSADLSGFIAYYKLQREKFDETSIGQDVLKVYFEDLVLNYDATLKVILDFLGEDESSHIKKRQFFNPDISIKGVGGYRKAGDQDAIARVTEELSEYCIENRKN